MIQYAGGNSVPSSRSRRPLGPVLWGKRRCVAHDQHVFGFALRGRGCVVEAAGLHGRPVRHDELVVLQRMATMGANLHTFVARKQAAE
jgi:hypothetical protein